jgi:serine/threonine-protein kinase
MNPASAARAGRFPQLAKYELLEELGHGGMATVYRARDKRLEREVAVKVIHPHLRDSREAVSRFNTEARAVAKLRHPNIVEVFDVSDEGESEQYLVVELLRGTTLRKLLLERKALPPEVSAAVAIELLGALGHAHANGVIHRDVKPENVLIEHRAGNPTGTPGTMVVKLTDFGIAKLLDVQGVTSTGQVLGSPAHMAPEQIEGGDVDARADIFGLGVLFYECMVGHLPFEGNNPAQVLRRVLEGRYPDAQKERPLVGNRWSAIADRALAHTPEGRFADANAMREAVTAELDRLGIQDAPAGLEAWFARPEAYSVSHTRHMIDRLVALGNDARKRGDAIAAAADYNRALAHAPEDPQLLRVVAALNRSEARARLLRRAAVASLLMVGLGGAAFGVGRFVRARMVGTTSAPEPSGATGVIVPDRVVVTSVPPVPVASGTPSSTPVARPPQPPHTGSAPKVLERIITLDLRPPMGVKLSIDDGPLRSVSTGWREPVDTRAHKFVFSCDVCGAREERTIAAGEKDETVSVNVPIKPGILSIRGDGNKTYQVLEDPMLVVRAGDNSIPLNGQFRSITVRQLETDIRKPVRLEAGQTITVSF